MRNCSIALVAFLFAGCVSQEGVTTYSYDLGVEEIVERRQELDAENADEVPTDLVVIGTISVLRPITEKNIYEIYAEYASFADSLHPNVPALYDRDAFLTEFAGWSRVKTYSIPMVYADYEFVLVPRDLSKQMRYPTRIGTWAAQETGDLVASRTNADGYFVVAKILCPDKAAAAECADQFHKGYFDGVTGLEIDKKSLTPIDAGKQIDPTTFHRVSTCQDK